MNLKVLSNRELVSLSGDVSAEMGKRLQRRMQDNVDAMDAAVHALANSEWKVKSANEQRAELIQRAREFVEEYQAIRRGDESKQDRSTGNFTARHCWYETDFFIKENKVTAVVYGLRHGKTRESKPEHIGRAKCAPGDVFNEWIGKAIALARALEIEIPVEFLNAIQPDEVVVDIYIL